MAPLFGFSPEAPEAFVPFTPEAPDLENVVSGCPEGQDSAQNLDPGLPLIEKRLRRGQGERGANGGNSNSETWQNDRRNGPFPSLVREGNLGGQSISVEVGLKDGNVRWPIELKPECPVPCTTSLHPAGHATIKQECPVPCTTSLHPAGHATIKPECPVPCTTSLHTAGSPPGLTATTKEA